MTSNYLSRLKVRQTEAKIKDSAAFGIFVGGMLFLLSAWLLFLYDSNNNLVWTIGFWTGLILFICGIIIPVSLYYPQKIWMKIGNYIGSVVFRILLTVIYFIVILPVGLIYQKILKNNPFYTWQNSSNDVNSEKWSEKSFSFDNFKKNKYSNNKLFIVLNVIKFFMNNKQWVLIPSLIILIIIGIIFFFIQSSVLAPFIYTLF